MREPATTTTTTTTTTITTNKNRDIEKHNYANTCLDEFLASKEDARWTEGVERLRPELRGIAAATLAIDRASTAAAEVAAAMAASTSGGKGEPSTAAVGVAAGGGVSEPRVGEGKGAATTTTTTGGPRLGNLRGLGGVQAGEEEEEEEEDELHDMEHHNEYLRDKPVRVRVWWFFVGKASRLFLVSGRRGVKTPTCHSFRRYLTYDTVCPFSLPLRLFRCRKRFISTNLLLPQDIPCL